MKKVHGLLLMIMLAFNSLALADKFLPPDEAFAYKAVQEGDTIKLSWIIEHGYYLYEEKAFAFIETDTEDNIDLPLVFTTQSVIKQDKNFGEVPVFFDKAEATVDISSLKPHTRTVVIEYQGCAKNGLCYQPQDREIIVSFSADSTSTPETTVAVDSASSASDTGGKTTAQTVNIASGNNEKTTTATVTTIQATSPDETIVTGSAATSVTSNTGNEDMTSTAGISRFLENASLLSTIGIFLLLGIGLSLTPCILPMIPILSGIIVGHGDKLTARHGILLSSAYVLGMATSYAIAGIIAATFGAQGNLQAYMQNPWVISVFSLVFVALSLSMFGLYNLALPSRMQNALYNLSNKQKGGHFAGVFVMGALSALVVSPCVSAPLAGALVFISSTGDKLVGGLALFALGIGMGFPLIAIGAGGGKLVPKAGVWMNHVKHFFGVVLLAVAIWLISRIIPAPITLLLWALLLIAYGIHSGALEPATTDKARLGKAISFVMVLYGALLFVGAMSGASDPLKPLQFSPQGSNTSVTMEKPLFTRVKNNIELTQAIELAKQQNKTVMLDFYADWCTACIDMEHNVFSKPETRAALANFVVLQIDVTRNTQSDKEVLNRFNLYGPPSILFFRNGEEIKAKSLQGEMPVEAFIAHVQGI